MSAASNAIAKQNGIYMEGIIKTLYPDAVYNYRGLINLYINEIPVEIKSCQEKVSDSSHKKGIRAGRLIFSEEQHLKLLENNGEYIILVHQQTIPIMYFRVPAKNIILAPFDGITSVSWKSVIIGALSRPGGK